MSSETPSDAFREIVIDGIREDIEEISAEWRSRTVYGKLQIAPLVMFYPLAAGAMIVAGSAMWVLFTAAELTVQVNNSVQERLGQLEPEVYKDDAE